MPFAASAYHLLRLPPTMFAASTYHLLRLLPTTWQKVMHRNAREGRTGVLQPGVGGFHVLDKIRVGMEAVLDIEDLAALPSLLDARPGVQNPAAL